MSSSRWRVLTAYLPGIASVVNSFQSPDVQMAVYQSLMKALDDKTEAEEAAHSSPKAKLSRGKSSEREAAARIGVRQCGAGRSRTTCGPRLIGRSYR